MRVSGRQKPSLPGGVITGTGGQLSIQVLGTVMCIRCMGAWNENTAKQGHFTILESAECLIDQPWAVLMNLEEWTATTPEATKWVTRCSRWMRGHNLVRNATVTGPHVFAGEIYQDMLAPAPRDFQLRVFESEDDGWEWLKTEGFGPSPD